MEPRLSPTQPTEALKVEDLFPDTLMQAPDSDEAMTLLDCWQPNRMYELFRVMSKPWY